MAKFAVILPAAGQSTRFQKQMRKKPFIELKGRPVWVRAVEHFANRDNVVQTVLVIAPDDMEWFKEKFRPNLAFLNIELADGGKTRSESVRNALDRVHSDVDFVIVHDAARPLLVKEWVDRVMAAAEKTGAAILAIPVTSTLKRVGADGAIEATVPREKLWQAQTPQVFRRTLLMEAFSKSENDLATDEAQLVEDLGQPVTVVEGSSMNLKITTSEDFKMAEVLLGALPKDAGIRALHPFADEDPSRI